ncbi:MAG: Lrp/AsnC family transcriptional regulator [Firmicutes bacterium]|nr:Lrp/AsnC family transcriptional regulator [Bacillota bacterium]
MDALDSRILKLLRENARMSYSEIGRRINLTIPSVAARVRKMEERGLIRGYTVNIDPGKASMGLLAITLVTLESPRFIPQFTSTVMSAPEVLECHHTTGDSDYMLKVAVADVAALERFLSELLKDIEGVRTTRTMVVLSTVKDTFGVDPPDDCAQPAQRKAAENVAGVRS